VALEKRNIINNPASVIFYIAGFIIIAVIIIIFGVISYYSPFFYVLIGNNDYSQGEYGRAIINYIKAREDDNSYYIKYNLGNVYFALGEIEPALITLTESSEAQDKELQYRVNYNLGNINYELGKYDTAVSYFIKALKANPDSVNAKINLELSVKRLLAGSRDAIQQASGSIEQELNEESREVLEIVQDKEDQIWNLEKYATTENKESVNDW
jgi:tetratricopeptide (TPR) repeat protein